MYVTADNQMTEVGIRSTVQEDLYLILSALNDTNGALNNEPGAQGIDLQVLIKPLVNWIWIGTLLLAIGTHDRALAERGSASGSCVGDVDHGRSRRSRERIDRAEAGPVTLYLGVALVAAAVVLFIVQPVAKGIHASLEREDDEMTDTEARKRVALLALRDVEYDFLAGKLDEEDYRSSQKPS